MTALHPAASSEEPDEGSRTVAGVISEAWHTGFALELGREEAAFIAGIHAYLRDALDLNLSETVLREIYVPLNELVHGDPDTRQQRCTWMVSRLKGQGILMRTDYGGLAFEAEYTLSPLGMAIAEYMDSERSLTRRSLEFVLVRLRAELSQVLEAARQGGDDAAWDAKVGYPLKFMVADLVRMVEMRQRGLDAANARLRADIGALLDRSWLAAVDTCTGMLGGVSATLMELMAVNSEHGESLMRLLGELSEACSGHTQTRDAVERVRVQLTRVLAWSSNRYDDWNQYFTTVNEFIRYVIQNDPENRVRSRIRDQLRRYHGRPHALRLVCPDPFLQPRTVRRPAHEEVVAIPDSALQNRGLSEYAEPPPDPMDLVLDALVRRLEQDREIDLVAAVMEEGRHLSDDQWFTLLSRATPVLLRMGVAPLPLMRQAWIPMSHRLQAQTLVIRAPGEPAADMTPAQPGAAHAV